MPARRPLPVPIFIAVIAVAGIKRHFPEVGTYYGLPDADHAGITNNSLEARAVRWREEDAWHGRLKAIDAQALVGRSEWVLYGFVREQLESSIGGRVCENELWAVDQMQGWQTMYGSFAQLDAFTAPGSPYFAPAEPAAFDEGWGLYAEKMADELRLYSTDADRLGMWQSRAFMKAHHLGTEQKIAPEVDRYIVMPGQATAYMGALEIERLRADAQNGWAAASTCGGSMTPCSRTDP